MASVIYNSMLEDLARGAIDFDTDTFRGMLVGSTYAAISNETMKDSHLKRSDITNEVSGTGYTAGGATVTCTVLKTPASNIVTLTFSNPSWTSSTITASGIVIYKSRGGAATADELVAFGDFLGSVSSTGATFSVTFSSPITFAN